MTKNDNPEAVSRLAAVAPKIKTPTQLIAFMFACLTIVVWMRGDTYFALIGGVAVILALICLFPLNQIISLLPKVSSLPRSQQADLYRDISRRIFQVITLLSVSSVLVLAMLVLSFFVRQTLVASDARAFYDELSKLLTARVYATEKLVERNGAFMAYDSSRYTEYYEIRREYNEKLNYMINNLNRYYGGTRPSVKLEFRRLRYTFVRLNCCIARLMQSDMDLDCGGNLGESKVPLETSSQLVLYPYGKEWPCIECVPCSAENLDSAIAAARGMVFSFLRRLSKEI